MLLNAGIAFEKLEEAENEIFLQLDEMKKGNISIHAQNIMPVIKKWLYSDKDIFVRELVSNACDAISKYKLLALKGSVEADEYRVDVTCNKEQGTLTITGSGAMDDFEDGGAPWEEYKDEIRRVVLSGSISYIGDYAFYNYSAMLSVTIPANIKSIGKDAFSGCDGLSKVNIEDVAAWCKIEFATALSNPLSIAGTLLVNGVSLTTLSLEGVDSISPRAFQGCNNIASLRSDSSLRSIGEEAFRGSLSLSSVELGEGVTTIEGKAFMGCAALKSITIPDSVTAIGVYAFGYCRNLTSVTIGKGVTSIGYAAFCDCSNLKAFYGKFASADNCYLVVNGVLHSFAIGCGATEFTVPNSVSEIGNSAFYNCRNLTSVTIGNSVAVIGASAFYDCSNLTEVYCKPTIPPTGGYNMFNNNAADRKIYVPAESLDAYKNHEQWSQYADKIEKLQN